MNTGEINSLVLIIYTHKTILLYTSRLYHKHRLLITTSFIINIYGLTFKLFLKLVTVSKQIIEIRKTAYLTLILQL